MTKPSFMSCILFGISATRPCRMIHGPDGRRYLERYFMFRVPDWVPAVGGWQAYLHRFVASDPDRGLHDHPWRRAYSVLLSGGYREQRLRDRHVGFDYDVRDLVAPTVNKIDSTNWHRVIFAEEYGECWSLFLHGRYIKGWGFIHPYGQDEIRLRNTAPAISENDGWLLYQPFTISTKPGGGDQWWRHAPLGRDANRLPLGMPNGTEYDMEATT